VRLTLRTLLAYLDDMLDPAETKRIGQKVAESDTAQELIARIKQVTRRRRLTTPPSTGPNAFEPNLVAEYLDNTLSPEQVAEVEKICLESDVHLAEIAAAHQILTLVLGQPALVPPSAKKRMYGLVHGRDAQIVRKAAPVAATVPSSADPRADEDETLLLGLSHRGQSVWLRWLLPISAALLLVVLAIALWQVFASNNGTVVAQRPDTNSSGPGVGDTSKTPDTSKGNGDSSKGPGGGGTPDNAAHPGPFVTMVSYVFTPDRYTTDIGGHSGPFVTPKPTAPSKERKELARYFLANGPAPVPTVLASRPTNGTFQRVKPSGRVSSTDLLLSLPGYRSEVRSDSGVDLILWGHLPEFSDTKQIFPLFDSAATLHVPDKGIDLDFTLDRGAVLIANHKDKDAAIVRLRFQDEVWDLSLTEPGAEIAVSLWSRFVTPYDSGDAPGCTVNLFVRRGKAAARVRLEEYPDLDSTPVPKVISWDNKIGRVQGPIPAQDPWLQDLLAVWGDPRSPANPEKVPSSDNARAARRVLTDLSTRLADMKPMEVALLELFQADSKAEDSLRFSAVYALGAIDDASALVDILGDGKLNPYCRFAAIDSLRQFIGRHEDQERKLYDPQTKSGVLIDKKFRTADAREILELLHTPSEAQRGSPDFWMALAQLLVHDKQAIRELALWHLVRLLPEGRKIGYNPTAPPEVLQATAQQWKELVESKSMPPKKP
jgi:hypothetical protein